MRSRNHFRVLQRKRYEARRFHNPYFQKAREGHWKGAIVFVGAAAAVLGVVAWLFGAERFAIQHVDASGAETIPSEQIVSRAWEELHARRFFFFQKRNRFLFDMGALRETLSSAYAFETLQIDWSCDWVRGGCSMQIQVKEKTSQLLWKSGEQVYLADLQGTVIRELTTEERDAWLAPDPPSPEPLPDGTIPPVAPPSPLKRLPLFTDVNSAPIAVGSTVLTATEVQNLFLFHARLAQLGIAFASTDVDRLAGKWIAIRTAAGYDILIDAAGDVTAQADHLEILLRDTVKDQGALEYVDLRFGDHVYYK